MIARCLQNPVFLLNFYKKQFEFVVFFALFLLAFLTSTTFSGWGGLGMSNNGGGQDWTAMDPAIVGGQLANPGAGDQPQVPSDFLSGALRGDLIGHGAGGPRPESPNTWLTANLEQLTSEPYPNLTAAGSNQLLSAFGSFSLERNGPLLGGRNPNTWGDNSSTPPPGFGNLRRPQYYPGSLANKISEP